MSEPGTAVFGRVLARRFQIINPRLTQAVTGEVSPVFLLGSLDDYAGPGARPFMSGSVGPGATVGERSAVALAVFAESPMEYVVRSIRFYPDTVVAWSWDIGLRVTTDITPTLAGVNFLLYADGPAQVVPVTSAVVLEGSDPIALVVAPLDNVTRPPNSGSLEEKYEVPFIVRPGMALVVQQVFNNTTLNVVFKGTERPLTV